ncbi:TonB-dependent receptor [Algoriphagus algorifonticola]|uniref:TonB-dependent receptor n=1 Tax=Algoriphagus algorifonticola TaxID=2593007 RepID=UPI0011A0E627|nr:TonB-dependent receptor [Algoriphagus algorifonticola]
MKKLCIPFCLALVFGAGAEVKAQIQSRGEVQDQEFVIRKDRVLTLPTQPRIFEKLPVLPQPKGLSDFNYQVNFYELNLPPVKLEAEPVQKNYRQERIDLYPGFLKAGYGNFASPLLEARFMATEVYDWNYAIDLRHQSFGKGPVLAEESKESHSTLGGSASYFMDQVELFGGLRWAQDSYSFYGVDSAFYNNPNLEFMGFDGNVLNTIKIEAGIRDIEKTGPVSYEGKINFRNFKDSYFVNENEFGLNAKGKFRPSDDWTGNLGFEYFFTNTEDELYQGNRTYFAIRPQVAYQYEAFNFSAGLNIISENDSIPGKSSDFRIFPNLKASYQFAEEFGFFGEFSGDVQRNTYYSFVMQNPFLGPSEQLLNTVNNYKLAGGIEGQFQGNFHYKAGIDISRFNQYHFFVNSGADTSRFEIVYDDKVSVLNINAELGLKLSSIYSLNSRLDIFQYDLNQQQEAWHRPTWQLGINNQVTPFKQLLIQANVNVMGGLKGRGYLSPSDAAAMLPYPVVNLRTIADLQLKADFKITEKIGVFAEGNNLLNAQNTRWLNYPVRGVQLIGGAWLKF